MPCAQLFVDAHLVEYGAGRLNRADQSTAQRKIMRRATTLFTPPRLKKQIHFEYDKFLRP